MRTAADSDSATSESDVENSYNTVNEVETDPASLNDLENVLAELYRLIGNSKKQSKLNKSGIKNIPIRQPKSSRKRAKSNTKPAKNVDNTEMNDGSKERLKLETKTG
ncbi:Hypothetical predicted protein [Paramuricea clavata]|uniref:Uncharacterized protein n=1 Tax=Paramuricea clavata TaxID=317549 RepID=A0A6S7G9A0_PARCT|nr:Hypothetical predicted protein [Paramuricea clavata]